MVQLIISPHPEGNKRGLNCFPLSPFSPYISPPSRLCRISPICPLASFFHLSITRPRLSFFPAPIASRGTVSIELVPTSSPRRRSRPWRSLLPHPPYPTPSASDCFHFLPIASRGILPIGLAQSSSPIQLSHPRLSFFPAPFASRDTLSIELVPTSSPRRRSRPWRSLRPHPPYPTPSASNFASTASFFRVFFAFRLENQRMRCILNTIPVAG